VKWERGEVGLGEKSRERTGDMEVREMGMNEKIVPKRNRVGIWVPLWCYRLVSYTFRKLF